MSRALRVAALGIALAGAAWSGAGAAVIDDAITADGIGRGFGTFLGTWDGGAFQPPGQHQPQPSGANAATIGALIKAVHPSFTWDPETEFNLAGSIDDYNEANTIIFSEDYGFVVTPIDGKNARWDYLGFPDGSSEPNPGNDPIDLFVAVKGGGGGLWSLFHYAAPPVTPGEYGYVTLDHRVFNNYEAPDILGGYDVCEFQDVTFNGTPYEDAFSPCLPWPNGNNPYSISHVTGYWPPADETPEPAALSLLGLGLLGVAALRRRGR